MLENMKKRITVVMVSVIFVALLISLILTIVLPTTKRCATQICYEDALISCERASFIYEGGDASWLYTIKGKARGECKVNVKLLQAKKGSQEIAITQGKAMDCYLPLRSVIKPQQNLEKCHGLLKEVMQDLIIRKMHSYILENMGKINEELKKPL